jgi:4-hydroxy-tetrahydrodipicolinate synthase
MPRGECLPEYGNRFGGVVAAAITPCSAVGVVDPPALTRLCRILIDQGCDGVLVLGSSGELPMLDEDDRRELTAAASEGVGPAATLYAGVTGFGLKQTIRHAENAAADGADAAVVMVPMMLKFSQDELAAYGCAVADASPIPVALYHHLRMPTPFQVDTVARLAQHGNIVAMKDTSVDMARLGALLEATAGTGMAIMQGSERLFLDSLRAGAAGCISALATVAPEWHADLCRAMAAGDDDAAEAHQRRITALWQVFGHDLLGQSFSCFAYAVKRMLQHRGWLEHTYGLMPGFSPPPELDHVVLEQLLAVEL